MNYILIFETHFFVFLIKKIKKITIYKRKLLWLLSLLANDNQALMKELEENTIEQIRTLLNYLEQTDLLKNKEILRCLDVIAREYGGEVVDKN